MPCPQIFSNELLKKKVAPDIKAILRLISLIILTMAVHEVFCPPS